MPASRILIVSDIHYASEAERARGDYLSEGIEHPATRLISRLYHRHVWRRDPFGHNEHLDRFIERAPPADLVVANGDFSCDSAFVGVSDDAACLSARQCLGKLRHAFGESFLATIGDHELGKISMAGKLGGMRFESLVRAETDLQLRPFWRLEHGRYVLMGVASSLVALPVFEPETLPEELSSWRIRRERHISEIRAAFAALKEDQRVLLFCHDPTALPFLWQIDEARAALPRIERTIIGHLHTELVLWKSRLLAGMPAIRFLGNSVRRMSEALNQARHWRPFNVTLCPALGGIELYKGGGYYALDLETNGAQPARFRWHGWKK